MGGGEMSEQKMREALEQARLALEPYDDVKPRDWISDRQRIKTAHALVVEALAQQHTAVPDYQGWYCAHCQRGIDASEVTFHEQHTVCGRKITDDRPPAAVVELTDQEMAKAVRHLCASDEVAMEFVDLSRDEYLAIIAAHIAKQGGAA